MEAEAHEDGLKVVELPLQHTDGMARGNLIGIRTGQTTAEKTCVLAEEIAHARYTVGNILDQNDAGNRKQERFARLKAYDQLIGLPGLIAAFESGCRSYYEVAKYLDVTEAFLREAVELYRMKYGAYVHYQQYYIQFEPWLSIIKFL
jgi:hypothetical protein